MTRGTKANSSFPAWLKVCLGMSFGLAIQLLVFSPIIVLFYYFIWPGLPLFFRSLPSDRAMIAHFHEHRADFERLVQIYREDLSVPTDGGQLIPTPEVQAIMDRIGVSSVRDDGMLWIPPNPYSTDSAFLKRRSNLVWKSFSSDQHETRKYSGVVLGYAHAEAFRFEYWAPVHKKYYYIPLSPKLSHGCLILPEHPWRYGGGPFVSSLDTYPPDLSPGGCAYMEIEPHWFVRMCQAEE